MSDHQYILFNKPYGVLCQFTDDSVSPRPTLKEYIDIPEVYSVGRLDFDSEGLLLLTNDGQLKHRLIDPQFEHSRTYWVQVERIPTEDALEQLRNGVMIQGYRTKPAIANLLDTEPDLAERQPPIRFRASIPTAWLELKLTEGKNRQVRKMTAAVGFPTLRLVRVTIAHLSLADLQVGKWRNLTQAELQELRLKVIPRRLR
ncbi:MAG: pseudouridine synthase [Pseudanabaena sp.]|jgi:23S rRNA pseudouridine2457 synthase|nr:pseudouridine synthase [Pseudanabaena sp. M172S2SP2A07QC]MCA6532253.1 pseudouridine synthase [Pseudanabaena sp. M125S2SP2A07QC]MCA6533959.1 pseudouridine synthase [Pseudanabaena sp. M176S2SP2A07QC]MCA6541140.1 pseudouridine synthase [Pseudanabaena sp. M037S2SP2A07QC]MCA6543972.1 pseudouridine synthase [Pseudanabaena sp. M074S1SP2A07QC]MCA6549603.1 pseudouridine synthase [Pseudanabaena sp. M152S2SP2A07QC]MCA6553659.1 pseudouridine synthase [Pseudanabaena sp. M135S2SP2A07QC]MCA6556268.1 pse